MTHIRFVAGYWCDNCEIATKGVDVCPDCGEEMRPAQVTVEPTDIPDEPSRSVTRRRKT